MRITDTYDVACLTLIRQGAGQLDTDAISAHEVERRIDRAKILAQLARFGVRVVSLESTDLGTWARRLGLEL
jgi:hypothetical protein